MVEGGDLDSKTMQRCGSNSKCIVKQTMLEHESIFRDQVHQLHRLYNVQQRLMNDVTCRDSGGLSKSPYPPLDSSQRATNVLPMFCSSTGSSILAENNHLEGQRKDADFKLNRPIALDLQRPSDMYISDAGSQSASDCFDIKDCFSVDKNNSLGELNILTRTKNDLFQKGGTGRILFCKDFDLECPAERMPLEEANGSSSVDESQTISAGSERGSQWHPVLGSLTSKTTYTAGGQGPSMLYAGQNAGVVGYTTLGQSCVPFKAMTIDLNAPQIDEWPSISQDPTLLPSAAASSSVVLNGPFESVTAQASVGSTKIPAISWTSDREACTKVFGSVLLSQQGPSSCNKFDMGMKVTEFSSLSPTGLYKSASKNLDPPLGSIAGCSKDEMKFLTANLGYKCEDSHLKASLPTPNLLHIAGVEGQKAAATDEKFEEDTISSTGSGDIVESDKTCAVLQDIDEVFVSSMSKDKLCIVQDSELARDDEFIGADPIMSEEFRVAQLEPVVAERSIEKMDFAQNKVCEQLQEMPDSYSKPYHQGENGEQEQEAAVMDITIQNAAEALIDLSRKKPDVFQSICNPSPPAKMNEESDCSSDTYVKLVLQLPEVNTDECTSLPKPVMETGGRTSKFKLRRGRKQLDFQKEVLSGLASLSRHEICEDLQMINDLLYCAEGKTNGSRRRNWSMSTRSRRSKHK